MLTGLVVVLGCALTEGDPSRTLPVVVAMLALGAGVGLLNGFLLNRLRLNPLILTFGMLSILQGAIFSFTDKSVGRASPVLTELANGSFLGIPWSVLLLLALFVGGHLLLTRSAFGYHLVAAGGKPESARRAGINVERIRLAAFAISGVTAGLAGLVLAGRIGTGYPLAGNGLELDAIVAVVLGGTALSGGRGSVLRSLGGVFLLAILSNVLNLLAVSAFVQMFVKGVIVIAAILVNQARTHMIAMALPNTFSFMRDPTRWAIFVVLIVIYLAGLMVSPAFAEANYLFNILRQVAPVGIAASGVTLVMILGGVDLSVGAVISLSAVLCAALMAGEPANLPLAIAACLVAGLAIGTLNGLLVAFSRVSPFILTLGMGAAVIGATLMFTGGTAKGMVSPGYREFFNFRIGGFVPVLALALLAATAAVLAVERLTVFGKQLFLIGSIREAAILSGLPVRSVTISAYALSGLFGGAGRDGAACAFGRVEHLCRPGSRIPGARRSRSGRHNVRGWPRRRRWNTRRRARSRDRLQPREHLRAALPDAARRDGRDHHLGLGTLRPVSGRGA